MLLLPQVNDEGLELPETLGLRIFEVYPDDLGSAAKDQALEFFVVR